MTKNSPSNQRKSKICTLCLKRKTTIHFYKCARSYDGLMAQCVPCKQIYRKQYYEENKVRTLAANKVYRAKNKKKLALKAKIHYQKNTERILARQKAYHAKHKKERRAFYVANRKAILAYARKYYKRKMGSKQP